MRKVVWVSLVLTETKIIVASRRQMFLSFLIGQVEGGLGALRPTRVFQAPKGAAVSPRSLPFLGLQPHLCGPLDGKGVTGELCSHPINQACGHT